MQSELCVDEGGVGEKICRPDDEHSLFVVPGLYAVAMTAPIRLDALDRSDVHVVAAADELVVERVLFSFNHQSE